MPNFLNRRIFYILYGSNQPIGGMPVATMITTREDEETIAFGLELLKYVLPDKAFYGRGADKGPALA